MKILITQDCAAPAIEGTAHLEANTVAELDTDTAHAVVSAGKALYIDPKDDPSKIKGRTASEARVQAVRAAAKAAAKAADKQADKAGS